MFFRVTLYPEHSPKPHNETCSYETETDMRLITFLAASLVLAASELAAQNVGDFTTPGWMFYGNSQPITSGPLSGSMLMTGATSAAWYPLHPSFPRVYGESQFTVDPYFGEGGGFAFSIRNPSSYNMGSSGPNVGVFLIPYSFSVLFQRNDPSYPYQRLTFLGVNGAMQVSSQFIDIPLSQVDFNQDTVQVSIRSLPDSLAVSILNMTKNTTLLYTNTSLRISDFVLTNGPTLVGITGGSGQSGNAPQIVSSFNYTQTLVIPEPGTWVAIGFAGLVGVRVVTRRWSVK